MNYKETENLIKKESFKEHNNCESLKADHNDSINLPSNSKYKDFCIFSRHVDFLKMTKDNCFYEEICDDDWNKQKDPAVIESYELEKNCDTTLENHKQESEIEISQRDDNLVNIIDLSNIRSDVQMKSVLRKIRRDLRTFFFQLTHFDVKVRKNCVQNFNQSLNTLSYHLFGENPTRKQTLTLGSLIYTKYEQQNLQSQMKTGEISEGELRESIKISKQIHQALYNFSEKGLIKLTMNEEFRDIMMMHSEIWGDQEMDTCDKYFYNKIISMFK